MGRVWAWGQLIEVVSRNRIKLHFDQDADRFVIHDQVFHRIDRTDDLFGSGTFQSCHTIRIDIHFYLYRHAADSRLDKDTLLPVRFRLADRGLDKDAIGIA